LRLGPVYLVPIFGPLLLLGWLQAVYDGICDGTLEAPPDVEWANHFARGLTLFKVLLLGMTLWMLPIIGAALIVSLAIGVTSNHGDDELVQVIFFASTVLLQVPLLVQLLISYGLAGEIGRRALNGDTFAFLRWRRSVSVVISHPLAYLLVLTGMMAAGMLVNVGIFACYFGFFLTLPLGAAVATHVLAQWHRYLQHHQAPAI